MIPWNYFIKPSTLEKPFIISGSSVQLRKKQVYFNIALSQTFFTIIKPVGKPIRYTGQKETPTFSAIKIIYVPMLLRLGHQPGEVIRLQTKLFMCPCKIQREYLAIFYIHILSSINLILLCNGIYLIHVSRKKKCPN